MNDHTYILVNGVPQRCSWRKWAAAFENLDNRRVALDELTEEIRVSTVFLGLDHNFGGGPPLLFETCVFGLEDNFMERYTTMAQARAGHARILKRVEAIVERRRSEDQADVEALLEDMK